MKMENFYFIGMTLFFCTTLYTYKKYRKEQQENIKLLTEKEASLIDQIERQKRLKNYALTSIRLNEICEETKTTRLIKAKDVYLQKLLNELN